MTALKNGVAIRFVPRSISGVKPHPDDDDGVECDLFCGRSRLSHETGMLVCLMRRRKLIKFVKSGPISFVRLV